MFKGKNLLIIIFVILFLLGAVIGGYILVTRDSSEVEITSDETDLEESYTKYVGANLIEESTSWETPSYYSTKDNIDTVTFFYETTYPEYDYSVVLDQSYVFTYPGFFDLDQDSRNRGLVYKVEVIHPDYIEEYLSDTGLIEIDLEEDLVLIAIYQYK